MSYTLVEIAAQLGGQVLGDGGVRIEQVATLEKAQGQHISFLTNRKYQSQLAGTQAGALILGEADSDASDLPRIISNNPYAYFARVSALLNPQPQPPVGIHPAAQVAAGAMVHSTAVVAATAVVEEGAKIGAHSVIGAGCYIGANVVIGEHALLYPRVVVYHDCVMGDRLIVHSGVVIGADGFGLAPDAGRWLKIPQIGRVVIGHDVEIGANTTIDRGALDDTVIEDGVKLDNLIQIGHNVRVGAHTAIASSTAVAGSTNIGQHCRIGGCVGIVGHIQIADQVEISGFTMVSKSIRNAGVYAGGFPFSSSDDWRKNAIHLRHLDELVKRIKTLEQEVISLKGKQA